MEQNPDFDDYLTTLEANSIIIPELHNIISPRASTPSSEVTQETVQETVVDTEKPKVSTNILEDFFTEKSGDTVTDQSLSEKETENQSETDLETPTHDLFEQSQKVKSGTENLITSLVQQPFWPTLVNFFNSGKLEETSQLEKGYQDAEKIKTENRSHPFADKKDILKWTTENANIQAYMLTASMLNTGRVTQQQKLAVSQRYTEIKPITTSQYFYNPGQSVKYGFQSAITKKQLKSQKFFEKCLENSRNLGLEVQEPFKGSTGYLKVNKKPFYLLRINQTIFNRDDSSTREELGVVFANLLQTGQRPTDTTKLPKQIASLFQMNPNSVNIDLLENTFDVKKHLESLEKLFDLLTKDQTRNYDEKEQYGSFFKKVEELTVKQKDVAVTLEYYGSNINCRGKDNKIKAIESFIKESYLKEKGTNMLSTNGIDPEIPLALQQPFPSLPLFPLKISGADNLMSLYEVETDEDGKVTPKGQNYLKLLIKSCDNFYKSQNGTVSSEKLAVKALNEVFRNIVQLSVRDLENKGRLQADHILMLLFEGINNTMTSRWRSENEHDTRLAVVVPSYSNVRRSAETNTFILDKDDHIRKLKSGYVSYQAHTYTHSWRDDRALAGLVLNLQPYLFDSSTMKVKLENIVKAINTEIVNTSFHDKILLNPTIANFTLEEIKAGITGMVYANYDNAKKKHKLFIEPFGVPIEFECFIVFTFIRIEAISIGIEKFQNNALINEQDKRDKGCSALKFGVEDLFHHIFAILQILEHITPKEEYFILYKEISNRLTDKVINRLRVAIDPSDLKAQLTRFSQDFSPSPSETDKQQFSEWIDQLNKWSKDLKTIKQFPKTKVSEKISSFLKNPSFSKESYTNETLLDFLANYIIELEITRGQIENLVGAVLQEEALKKAKRNKEKSQDYDSDLDES